MAAVQTNGQTGLDGGFLGHLVGLMGGLVMCWVVSRDVAVFGKRNLEISQLLVGREDGIFASSLWVTCQRVSDFSVWLEQVHFSLGWTFASLVVELLLICRLSDIIIRHMSSS